MGAQLLLSGMDFTANPMGFAAPVPNKLEYWNYFGGAAAKTANNNVVGKSKGTVVGTPVVASNYVTFVGNTAYVVTGLVDQSEVTFLAVARPTAGDGAKYRYLIGSFASTAGANVGSNLYLDNQTIPRPTIAAARNNAGTDANVANAVTGETDTSGFAFYAGRIGASLHRVDDKTRNLNSVGSVANPRSTPNGVPYRIGDDAGVVSTGSVDFAWAAIYSRVLTDTELQTVYVNVQSYLGNSRSILI